MASSTTPKSGNASVSTDPTAIPELSIVMPCLNEAETLESCILKAQRAVQAAQIRAEIIVADNASTDNSAHLARRLGAKVVNVESRGYGSALMGGIEAASGQYVVIGDADDSYDFAHVPQFLERLRSGADLVIGNRFAGGIRRGAMPFLHRYVGNPVLTRLGRLFFGGSCGDFCSGMRGFSKDAYQRMDLRTTGMEFATEMIVKANLLGMKVAEVPITLSPDGRTRPPHLRTWRDGWRTLRFFLLYSPRWLFLYPGLALMVVGLGAGIWLLPGPRRVGQVTFDVNTLLYCAIAILLGFQSIAFAIFSKSFAISEGLHPPVPWLTRIFHYINLEAGLMVGSILSIVGLALSVYAVNVWKVHGFGPLDYSRTLHTVIPAVLCLTLGAQTVFASFFLSVLGMHRK
ncbi:MAG TPA: glycosyltransferase family 2 protein [Terriglobales bacterium]|nr:glycosyltransferase family 2 protein [Terriglobales bacterium]